MYFSLGACLSEDAPRTLTALNIVSQIALVSIPRTLTPALSMVITNRSLKWIIREKEADLRFSSGRLCHLQGWSRAVGDGIELHRDPLHEQIPGNVEADKLTLVAKVYWENPKKGQEAGPRIKNILPHADKRKGPLGEIRTDEAEYQG